MGLGVGASHSRGPRYRRNQRPSSAKGLRSRGDGGLTVKARKRQISRAGAKRARAPKKGSADAGTRQGPKRAEKNSLSPSPCRAAKLPHAAASGLNLLRPYGS